MVALRQIRWKALIVKTAGSTYSQVHLDGAQPHGSLVELKVPVGLPPRAGSGR